MAPADQPSVLVVEDEPAQREVLSYNFEAEGFRVTQASNGEEALMLVEAATEALPLTVALQLTVASTELLAVTEAVTLVLTLALAATLGELVTVGEAALEGETLDEAE